MNWTVLSFVMLQQNFLSCSWVQSIYIDVFCLHVDSLYDVCWNITCYKILTRVLLVMPQELQSIIVTSGLWACYHWGFKVIQIFSKTTSADLRWVVIYGPLQHQSARFVLPYMQFNNFNECMVFFSPTGFILVYLAMAIFRVLSSS